MIAADAHLRPAMVKAMIAHAAEASPREACGLIVYDGAGCPVRLYPATNVHPDPDRFELDPVEHFGVVRDADEHGWRIGAVYHSHPRGPARPSATDLAAGIDPDWISYVIGRNRTATWVIRAYKMADGRAIPLGEVAS
ncbi:MAG: M67 family metallopeptidase [bacterium]|nr:M67 family metallopeptidase [bacterium]